MDEYIKENKKLKVELENKEQLLSTNNTYYKNIIEQKNLEIERLEMDNKTLNQEVDIHKKESLEY